MGFFVDLATALDEADITARVHGDTLYVPINPQLEMQFVAIDEQLPAANVYIAEAIDFDEFPASELADDAELDDAVDYEGDLELADAALADAAADSALPDSQEDSLDADVDEESASALAAGLEDDFVSTLVAVVFSVEDAVQKIEEILATEQTVELLEQLLVGDDPRLSQLDFYQDLEEPLLVCAEVAEHSQLQVLLDAEDPETLAAVSFITAVPSAAGASQEAEIYDPTSTGVEVLNLGEFVEEELLFDALALAAQMAGSWEEQLAPVH